MSQKFDVFFAGEILEDCNESGVRDALSTGFNLQPTQLDHLFSGSTVAVKKGIDGEAAAQYRLAFRKAGALVEIRPSQTGSASQATEPAKQPNAGEQPDQGAPQAPAAVPPAASGLTLSPPKTGSLIDCAEEVIPAVIPDISAINLSPEGAQLDDTPEPPPANINTDALNLSKDDEPNFGS